MGDTAVSRILVVTAILFALAWAWDVRSEDAPVCPSYLGFCSPHWPCEQSLAVLENQSVPCLGWLNVTFGKECPCAKAFLIVPGPKLARVHLANCTCFPERGRTCGADEPFRGESIASADKKLRNRDPALLRRYRRNLRLAKRTLDAAGPETRVLLSLCLESPFSDRARRTMLREARKAFPDGVFVDSVLKQRCLPGLVCEKHGVNPRPPTGQQCSVDTDGGDYRGLDVPTYREKYGRCEAVFVWEPSFNLLDPTHEGFVDPRRRTAAPTDDDFDALRQALL